MLLVKPKGRRYDKETILLAAELYNVSPAAYKMLLKSGTLALPSVKIIKQLLSNSSSEENLKSLLSDLKPQQKLINILFDDVKLVQATRFTGGHVHGHAKIPMLQILLLLMHLYLKLYVITGTLSTTCDTSGKIGCG